jgi:SSS family transporter
MITLAATNLSALDWAVVGGYLLLLLGSGIWFARREPSGADEYFLAGRRMPAWAVSFSVIASALSVATFIGAPELSFKGDLTYLSTTLGTLIAVAVVAGFFIPAFYKRNVTTVYELLEQRFGRGAKHAASAAFMVGRMMASGARVYIAAIPLSMVLFGQGQEHHQWHLIGAILVLSAVAILYTLIGGIASVIWTDVIQVLVLIGAALGAAILLIHKIPLPVGKIAEVLQQPDLPGQSKLAFLPLGFDQHKPHMGFDPSETYTLLTAVFGFSLLNMAAYGTDHDLAQRVLTCKSAVKGSRSAWIAIVMNVPITCLFMLIGLLLFVFYGRPDVMGGARPAYAPPSSEKVFVTFILRELPAGFSGLMLAGLFAAGLGSLNSAINAMAATFVKDFYINLAPGKTERHYLLAGRWAVAGWGAVLAAFATTCIFWREGAHMPLVDFALSVMNFAYAGLLAVFLAAIFTRRGNSLSAIAALVTGAAVVALLQPSVWTRWTHWFDTTREWGDLKLAYPWHMMIATLLAFGVCCLGRRNSGEGDVA